ncbi:MAG: helix-turn-helix domain-containing protein [Rhodospirillales bacterium]|nr:helix-turn-helix domain-containing protein [Rhodospirillales bacterium]
MMKIKEKPHGPPDPIDIHVGSRVRAQRIGHRLSQSKLGEAIGVTFQQIQKYEKGSNRIGASNLYKIAKTLGVDVSFFFDGFEAKEKERKGAKGKGLSDQKQSPVEYEHITSREAVELIHNYFKIKDPLTRKHLYQFIKSLSK